MTNDIPQINSCKSSTAPESMKKQTSGIARSAAMISGFLNIRHAFLYLLSFSSLSLIVLLGLESYWQHYSPESCLLSRLHSYNLFTEYKVIYEPNRGMWHAIGWTGLFLMLAMHIYSLRKKAIFMHEWGMLRHWLDFHIYCGIIGPLLITFHTTFKLGGIVSISYWSMITVVLSGLFGRYIFGLIPRGIAGNELMMEEIGVLDEEMSYRLGTFYANTQNLNKLVAKYITSGRYDDKWLLQSLSHMMADTVRSNLKLIKLNRLLKLKMNFAGKDRRALIDLIKHKLSLARKISFLKSSHRLFLYWHYFHMIFAVATYAIAVIHIVIFYLFRVKT